MTERYDGRGPAGVEVLGRYELLMPIAKGGMAEVWAARLRGSRGFQKIVAVKTILPGAIDDLRMEQMFLEEAALASQIHHPNVVEVLELGEDDGTLYLAMEWVDGESLSFIMTQAADNGGVPLSIAVNLIGQACKGLHAAHELRDESGTLLGVVHRDISPHNVLVTCSGTAKLVDFGIAKATAHSLGLTRAGEVKGKITYLSPEQIVGVTVDRRSDIFVLGTLLYVLTTHRHPFRANNPAQTLKNVCSDAPPRSPSQVVPGYPPELEAVVLKALSKDPEGRWATANDMLAALELAVPEYLEGSFEVRVADYMSRLLGERSKRRHAQLVAAQRSVDLLLSDRPAARADAASVRSLRATSIDAVDADGTTSRRAQGHTTPSVSEPLRAPSHDQPFRWLVAMSAAGALGGFLVAFVLLATDRARPIREGVGALGLAPAALSPAPSPASSSPTSAPANTSNAGSDVTAQGAPNAWKTTDRTGQTPMRSTPRVRPGPGPAFTPAPRPPSATPRPTPPSASAALPSFSATLPPFPQRYHSFLQRRHDRSLAPSPP